MRQRFGRAVISGAHQQPSGEEISRQLFSKVGRMNVRKWHDPDGHADAAKLFRNLAATCRAGRVLAMRSRRLEVTRSRLHIDTGSVISCPHADTVPTPGYSRA